MSMTMPPKPDRIEFIHPVDRDNAKQSQCLVDRIGLAQRLQDNLATGPDDRELTTIPAEVLRDDVSNRAALRLSPGPAFELWRQWRRKVFIAGRIDVVPGSFKDFVGQRNKGNLR